MGADIHVIVERRDGGVWRRVDCAIFARRDYRLFGFLAGVRNYAAVTPIAPPRGLPADLRDTREQGFVSDDESYRLDELDDCSYLLVGELLALDYERLVEDRRYTEVTPAGARNGGATCAPGQGEVMTLRSFLGPAYFEDLRRLREAGAERIVFGFDT